jgi:hypothetical protein
MGSREWALTSDTPEIDADSSDNQAGMSIRTGFRDDNRAELDDVPDVIGKTAAAPRTGSRPVARDSLPVTGVGDSNVRKLEDHKQLVLQKACRRIGKSSSGSKSMLVQRLCNSSFDSYEKVEQLARDYELSGKSVGDEAARKRSPNWTANETARLSHVLVDPSNSTALTRLVSRASREQLDVGLHDPWSEEFVSLFNNPTFVPEVPEIAGGAVQETLDKFDPGELKHSRDAAKLKSQWSTIRSKFTVAYKGWSSSGQGDVDAFPSFCEGDDALVYVFCVFSEKPAMEQVLRLIPENARLEDGLTAPKSMERQSSVSRKRQRDTSGSQNIESDLACAIRDSFKQQEGSRVSDMADAVAKLMTLEKTLAEMIASAISDEDERRYEGRILIVRNEIDKLLGITHDE